MINLGECECGCGESTTISTTNDKFHGYIAGQPRRFKRGHRVRMTPTRSIEQRQKISNSKKSVSIHSAEWKNHLSARWKGINNPNFKDGKSQERKTGRYTTAEYRRWRTAIFERDDFTCQNCGLRGVYLEPHHLKSYADHPLLRFNIDNGVTLCLSCHIKLDPLRAKFVGGD